MNLKSRLNLALTGLCLAALAGTAVLLDHVLREHVRDEVHKDAVHQMAVAQAVRAYTTDEVRPLLLDDPERFHAPAVPSHAAVAVMSHLQSTFPGYRYREVAFNPTNPANRASPAEQQMLEQLRRQGGGELTFESTDGARPTHNYARAIIATAPCLSCHGRAEEAPRTMITRYGGENGFGWQLGDVIGAQIVSLPAADAAARTHRIMVPYLGGAAVLLVVLYALLNAVLSRVVIQPAQTHQHQLRRLAAEDGLTGLANRRAFDDRLDEELAAHARHEAPSLLMVDIDRFKQINDAHGHAVGDTVLREIGTRLGLRVRAGDLLARIGGEEFALLLPATSLAHAMALAEELRALVADRPFPRAGTVTCSIGVGQRNDGESRDAFVQRVDAALYAAKRAGRNRVAPAA